MGGGGKMLYFIQYIRRAGLMLGWHAMALSFPCEVSASGQTNEHKK